MSISALITQGKVELSNARELRTNVKLKTCTVHCSIVNIQENKVIRKVDLEMGLFLRSWVREPCRAAR